MKGRQRTEGRALAQLLWLNAVCVCVSVNKRVLMRTPVYARLKKEKVSGDVQSGRHALCLDILLILTVALLRV